jgi:hypothetical protein
MLSREWAVAVRSSATTTRARWGPATVESPDGGNGARLGCSPAVRHKPGDRPRRSQATAAARGRKIRGRSVADDQRSDDESSGQPHGTSAQPPSARRRWLCRIFRTTPCAGRLCRNFRDDLMYRAAVTKGETEAHPRVCRKSADDLMYRGGGHQERGSGFAEISRTTPCTGAAVTKRGAAGWLKFRRRPHVPGITVTPYPFSIPTNAPVAAFNHRIEIIGSLDFQAGAATFGACR